MDKRGEFICLDALEQNLLERALGEQPCRLPVAEAPELFERICERIDAVSEVQRRLLGADIHDIPERERLHRSADVEGNLCALSNMRSKLARLAGKEIVEAATNEIAGFLANKR